VLHYKSKLYLVKELTRPHQLYINTFENSDNFLSLRKARAVPCSSPLERLGEALYSAFSKSLIIIRVSEKRGLCFDGLLRPHPPSPSPKERERCFKSLMNFITTIPNQVRDKLSTLYLYSTLSKTLITF
jgi:hypothetical protein